MAGDVGRHGQTSKWLPDVARQAFAQARAGVDIWSAEGEWGRPRSTMARADWPGAVCSFPNTTTPRTRLPAILRRPGRAQIDAAEAECLASKN
jgi:hypothetical protein